MRTIKFILQCLHECCCCEVEEEQEEEEGRNVVNEIAEFCQQLSFLFMFFLCLVYLVSHHNNVTTTKREANFLLRFTVAPKSYNLKISTHWQMFQTTTYYIIKFNIYAWNWLCSGRCNKVHLKNRNHWMMPKDKM